MTDSLRTPSAVRTPRRSRLRAILLTVPMFLLTFLMLAGGPPPHEAGRLVPFLITFALVNVLFYKMLRTGRTERYRAILFIAMAVAFVLTFIPNLVETRGSMMVSRGDMIEGRTPFCHMVIPMTIIPAVLTRTIVFPGHLLGGFAPIAGMIILWLAASLALGRGFCAWGCFFGGIEDGFSRLLRRARIRKIPRIWSYLPYAILLTIVLTSAAAMSPTYCMWLCPFKSVTEFEQVTSTRTVVQAGICFSLFGALVVALPILTRKRTQCGLFCPFGAFQSFTNHVNPFEVKVDRTACTDCRRCLKACPTFSIDEESVQRSSARISCCKCGACVDACPEGAAVFHIRGTNLRASPERARLLFIYPAFLFLATMSGGMIQAAIHRLVLLVTTGRMIA